MNNLNNMYVSRLALLILAILVVNFALYSQDVDSDFSDSAQKQYRMNYFLAGASYFMPSESRFTDIYGNGVQFEGLLSINLWKELDIWIGGSYFKKKGELSFTKEETSVQIIPIGGGLQYRFPLGNFSPYLGLGAYYYMFKETNPVKDTNDEKLGYVARLGGILRITNSLVFNFHADYTYCEIEPENVKINIGGICAGLSLGILF